MKTEELHLTRERVRCSDTYSKNAKGLTAILAILPLLAGLTYICVADKISGFSIFQLIAVDVLLVVAVLDCVISIIRVSEHPEDYIEYTAEITHAELKVGHGRSRTVKIICTFSFVDTGGSMIYKDYTFNVSSFANLSMNLSGYTMQIAYDEKRNRFIVFGELPV